MHSLVRSFVGAALASAAVALVACIIDTDPLTNGQCPESTTAIQNKCVRGDASNACLAGLDNCAPEATCEPKDGDGFTCICPAGTFSPTGDGTTCVVDPCAPSQSGCDPKAACTRLEAGVKCTCPPGSKDVGEGKKCVTGDSCATPTVVPANQLPVSISDDTSTGMPNYGIGPTACPGVTTAVGKASNDKVYSFTPTVSDTYVFTLRSEIDAALYIVTDCSAIATSCIGAVDSLCTNCTESLTKDLNAGTTYFIIVDGSSDTVNQTGGHELSVRPLTVQFDVSEVLTADTILNAIGDAIDENQDGVDNNGHVIPTQPVATALGTVSSIGVPATAYFSSTQEHPNVQLHWGDSDNDRNSRIVTGAGQPFTFKVPEAVYHHIQLYGLTADFAASMDVTFTYQDKSSDVVNGVVFPKWTASTPPANLFILVKGITLFVGESPDENVKGAIFGYNVEVPSPTKKLSSLTVNVTTANGRFVFYGASAN